MIITITDAKLNINETTFEPKWSISLDLYPEAILDILYDYNMDKNMMAMKLGLEFIAQYEQWRKNNE